MHKACASFGGRIDAIFFCPHTMEANCSCRKPNSGMIEEIAQRYNMELNGVPAVGDSLRDLEATARLGATPFLVLTGKGKKTQANGNLPEGTQIFPDLAAVVTHILA
jgi:D-glycero-D-manno-heptose 1,7-bisphosphate phosphatase